MRSAITLFCCLLHLSLFADFLQVSRAATLKAGPTGDAEIIVHVKVGAYLTLVEDKQVNGYFLASIPNSTTKGWIYRTLVRRHTGSIPTSISYSTQSTTADGRLEVYAIDVGQGSCNVIKLPDGRLILYDAGHFMGNGNTSYSQIAQVIGPNSEIELMVLSHTDADHMGAAGHLLSRHPVKTLVHTGYEKSKISREVPTATYDRFTNALATLQYPIKNINLYERDSTITPGTTLKFGDVTVTFLCGFGKPPMEWDLSDRSKKLNSVSIVMKVEYAGKSILFTGDAVGKTEQSDDPIATELYLLQNSRVLLDSDVLFAPHHGADNASSTAFIEAVSPSHVIFSAGHEKNYAHPRRLTAERYLNFLPQERILRTDRGDDAREELEEDKEWDYDRIPDCDDTHDDDDILITISKSGLYTVAYINPINDCRNE